MTDLAVERRESALVEGCWEEGTEAGVAVVEVEGAGPQPEVPSRPPSVTKLAKRWRSCRCDLEGLKAAASSL